MAVPANGSKNTLATIKAFLLAIITPVMGAVIGSYILLSRNVDAAADIAGQAFRATQRIEARLLVMDNKAVSDATAERDRLRAEVLDLQNRARRSEAARPNDRP